MVRKLSGGCCCGEVQFEVKDEFKHFFFCHCEQCRKLTGAAHATNLFTAPDNIKWLKGEEHLVRFVHPERAFVKVFCKMCGSGLPYINKSGKFLIVPAGSLNQEPTKTVDARIFISEQPEWHKNGLEVTKFDGFPH
ncbi:GFA family protein [Vibrio intestinalis]|uniref:GFA family protein n=1 Tax=Vibrio intestinalis TaxID=2933291 RepID=UPI0021A6386C|nr:GFA family protein [Vibrio intestinalis]